MKKEAEKTKEAQAKIEKIRNTSQNTDAGSILTRVLGRIETERKKDEKIELKQEISKSKFKEDFKPQPAKSIHRTDKLSRCSKQERKLISKIFSIIIKIADETTAENIIQKIEEEFK